MSGFSKLAIGLLVLLAAILVYIGWAIYVDMHEPVVVKAAQFPNDQWVNKLTDEDLTAFYVSERDQYFGNKLPDSQHVIVMFCDGMRKKNLSGSTMPLLNGQYFIICVDSTEKDTPEIALEIELHEMVHVELDGKTENIDVVGGAFNPDGPHGRLFQAEMKRLAMEGAFEYLW